ncbi:MAG: hypothetical protein AAB875_01855, partial [Patescibacteria group bacterium]
MGKNLTQEEKNAIGARMRAAMAAKRAAGGVLTKKGKEEKEKEQAEEQAEEQAVAFRSACDEAKRRAFMKQKKYGVYWEKKDRKQ